MASLFISMHTAVDIRVTRFEGILPNKGKRKGGNGPRPVFKPRGERGQREGVILCRSIISEYIYLISDSFIEADTQFILSTGWGRKLWNCSLGWCSVVLPWETPTTSKCVLCVSHVPALCHVASVQFAAQASSLNVTVEANPSQSDSPSTWMEHS